MAFCTTLRRRPSWSGVIPILMKEGLLKGIWMYHFEATIIDKPENKLDTHDISIHLQIEPQPLPRHNPQSRQLRVLLLSQHAVEDGMHDTTMSRIRRFGALTAGRDLVIVFLLAQPSASAFQSTVDVSFPQDPDDQSAGLLAYYRLQMLLLAQPDIPTMPILPLANLMKLSNLVHRHAAAIAAKRPSKTIQAGLTSFELLRQCTMHPPMDETMAYYITDTFDNMRELATTCCSIDRSALYAQTSDGPSPYFSSSSSSSGSMPSNTKQDPFQKLQRLSAINKQGTMEMLDFWQTRHP